MLVTTKGSLLSRVALALAHSYLFFEDASAVCCCVGLSYAASNANVCLSTLLQKPGLHLVYVWHAFEALFELDRQSCLAFSIVL